MSPCMAHISHFRSEVILVIRSLDEVMPGVISARLIDYILQYRARCIVNRFSVVGVRESIRYIATVARISSSSWLVTPIELDFRLR